MATIFCLTILVPTAFKSWVLAASVQQGVPQNGCFCPLQDGLYFSCPNTLVLFVWRQRGCIVLVERLWLWSVFPQGYRGSIKGRTMASAHFSLSLQQICQSCSETSLISPACSAWHSNPTYRGHVGALDGHNSAAASHASPNAPQATAIPAVPAASWHRTYECALNKLRILSCITETKCENASMVHSRWIYWCWRRGWSICFCYTAALSDF